MRIDCPNCRAAFSAPSPVEKEAAVCIECGFLGVWRGGVWTPPGNEERRNLLKRPIVLKALEISRERNEARLRDRAALTRIVGLRVDDMRRGFTSPHEIVALIVADAIAAGWHTCHEGDLT